MRVRGETGCYGKDMVWDGDPVDQSDGCTLVTLALSRKSTNIHDPLTTLATETKTFSSVLNSLPNRISISSSSLLFSPLQSVSLSSTIIYTQHTEKGYALFILPFNLVHVTIPILILIPHLPAHCYCRRIESLSSRSHYLTITLIISSLRRNWHRRLVSVPDTTQERRR